MKLYAWQRHPAIFESSSTAQQECAASPGQDDAWNFSVWLLSEFDNSHVDPILWLSSSPVFSHIYTI